MRSITSHAAESSVGEHTARESESAHCMYRERLRGEQPPPILGPGLHGPGPNFLPKCNKLTCVSHRSVDISVV